MSDFWLRDEFPHEYRRKDLYKQQTEMVRWCVEQFGAAAHSILYDNKNGVLYLQAINPNGVWYPIGNAIVFKNTSDLVLFKLTFG